jgi:hypothetical protein
MPSHHHPYYPPTVFPPVRSTAEPWLAAQNLTFLKRGSPSPAKTDIPSLAAASSDGTSPDEKSSPKGAGVNSLLMAAMAMTEAKKTTNDETHHTLSKSHLTDKPASKHGFTAVTGVEHRNSLAATQVVTTPLTKRRRTDPEAKLN